MRHAASVLLLVVALAAVAGGQQPTFRSGVDVVRIDASVMNGLTPLAGLTRDQFVLVDNGVAQTVDSAVLESVPLSLTLVLDTSESMRGERIDRLIDGAKALIKALHPQDDAALVTFSEPVRLAVPMTRNRQVVLDALDALEPDGATSLNDAVFLGLQLKPMQASDSRPVLLAFSDGHDTSSWLSNDQLLDATRRSNLLLHVIELLPAYGMSMALRPSELLRNLAKAGGGRHWAAQKPSDLNDLFGKALNELRARYLLTYTPTGVTRQGWHDVKVTLKNARGDVTARPGYYVP